MSSVHKLRRRDLLLSLKHSTIEACFSVPMLNLTMPNLPFAIAFVVAALHWPAWAVGFMAALPYWCNFVQPPIARALQRRLSLYQIMVLGFACSALPWTLAPWLPWLGHWRNQAFAVIITLTTLANSIASVAWSASIAEVVPQRISGKYFGRRNLIFGFWALVATLIAGVVVDLGKKPLLIFVWIFAAAGLARLLGLFFLTRMKFPPSVVECQPHALRWTDFAKVLRDLNYFRLVLFIGLWGLMLNMAMPFFTVYLLDELRYGVVDVVKLTTIASIGGLVTVKAWGALCDRFGSKPVLYVSAISWALVGLVSWFFVGPKWNHYLYLTYLLIGATTAGFQLCQFNLMVQLVPDRPRAPYIAVFLAVTSLLTAFGPSLGGMTLSWIPHTVGVLFGHHILNYHLLFSIAMFGCLLSAHVLSGVREAEARPVEQVWRTMWTMRSFNPLLMMGTAAEYFFTPRGMMGFARHSLRSLRKQAKEISEVGEEILEGGQRFVRSSIPKRK